MSKKVLIITPGGPGGISRFAQYLSAEFNKKPDRIAHQVINSWHSGSKYHVRGVLIFLKCLSYIVFQCSLGKVSLVHIQVSSRGSAFRKYMVTRLVKLFSLPVVLHIHASNFRSFFDGLPNVFKHLILDMFNTADKVITLGHSWYDYFSREIGISTEKLEIVNNGTPPVIRTSPIREVDSQVRILFLGQIGKRKGVPELIGALSDPRILKHDWKATIAGDGEVDRFRTLVNDLHLENRIEFPEWIRRDDVELLLLTSDIFVLPSHDEGLPMSILEAMSCGLAIVTTPVGSITEAVEDEVTGLIVPSGDIEALVDALDRLLGDINLRQKLGKRAQEIFMEKFDIKICAEKISLIYKSVL